jgi:APA family basic amino acid/polyamine antiporter
MNLFRRKSVSDLQAEALTDQSLKRALGPVNLTALGVGAIIGTGIFVLTGTVAAQNAGPAVVLSFVLAGFASIFAALCYSEFASLVPMAGSAYTYGYATLGELFAWIIGWDLILEYAVSNMAVAVGFSAYVDSLLRGFGIELPHKLMEPMFVEGKYTGAYFNVPGFMIVMILTVSLVVGIRESASANNLMVCVKILAILIFIVAASRFIHVSNWKPFMPNGWQGVLTGGAIVFFTYIGFDSVSTAAEECKNPQKDVPFGIIASLVVCATLYVTVALVLTGVQNWQTLRNAAPVANALMALGMPNVMKWVSIGALTGMISSLLVFQLGQARVWFAMSRDGLLPQVFSKVHPRFLTPHVSTWMAGFFVAIPAGMFDIGTLADLSNIGTLFAFVLVSLGVLVLRQKQPERRRSFRTPWVPAVPILAIVSCVILMASLPIETWVRFLVWLVIGLGIYLTYSRHHSEFGRSPRTPMNAEAVKR